MALTLCFSASSPPPATARTRRNRPALWRPRKRTIQKPPAPPLQPALKYSLAHRKGAARFTAVPILVTPPEKGVHRIQVACPTCREPVTVLVRSHAAVTLERMKRLAYILLAAGVLFALTSLIPWGRLFSGSDTCVSLFALLAFGVIGLYNGAQAIAPEASLRIDLPRKPFMEMFPSLDSTTHTILKKNP
jgi:hypothetical protein